MSEPELMTVEEVAAFIRVSERTVYDWAQNGVIPAGKLGSTWRFKRSEVQKWVDRRLNSGASLGASDTELARVVTPERIVFLPDGLTKKQALDAVIDVLAKSPQVKRRDELSEAIYKREGLMSTGIGLGVAVPHVRLESVSDMMMAVGISRSGVSDYDSLDGKPVHLICMLAASAGRHEAYLKFLALLSGKLKVESFRQALVSAADAASVWRILTA